MFRLKKKKMSRSGDDDDDDNNGGGGILLTEYNTNRNSSSSFLGDFFDGDEYMVVEILSKLPVKSLLRFKCVSKRWCSLIQDPYFVDLHSARSITRPGATFFISRDHRGRNITFLGSTGYDGPHFHSIDYVSFIADHPARNLDTFGPHYFQLPDDFIGDDKLKSTQILNGLLCMSFKQETVWILNPSTRKTILFTKTNIKEEENNEETIKKRDGDHDEYNWMNKESFVAPKYAFGFDPVTKKYKLICICQVNIKYYPPQLFLYHPDEDHNFYSFILKTYYLCMVLTIDDDDCCWRRIDEIPPYPIHECDCPVTPVYLNGVIYWGNINSTSLGSVKVIVAFNVSSEKFSVIKIPDFIHSCNLQLYEVDGCLSILVGNKKAAKTIQIWKLVVLPPPDVASSSCWVKETILTLSFDWRNIGYAFEFIAGTNQILLKRYNSRGRDASFWCYDRDNNVDHAEKNTKKEKKKTKEKLKTNEKKKKKKTREKLEFAGECASFTGILPSEIGRRIHTCTETLWSINN